MNRKYEITDIVHPKYPWLHRIRALQDVRENVHAGDLGGFVQSEENLSQEGSCWIFDNAIAAEESCVSGNADLRDFSCARGSAVICGESQIHQNATVKDCAIVTAGCIGGNAHIAGNAEVRANCATGCVPVVSDDVSVYGELGGNIEVHKNSVILPGNKIDNPTTDAIHIYPDDIVVIRESKFLSPPLDRQEDTYPTQKRRRGKER